MRYLIDFKNSASQQEIDDYLSNYSVIKTWNNFEKIYLVEGVNVPVDSSILDRWVEEDSVSIKPLLIAQETNPHFTCHSDPNAPKITIEVENNKDWWKNYSFFTPVFDQPSYEISRLGKNFIIYLMDSGIEKSHPEFEHSNIVDLYSVVPGDFGDKRGHGTGLASLMVGKTCGITDATIKNVKIFEPGHTTLQSELLSALDAIIEDHEDNTYAVCNCSWAIEKNEWVEHKLQILNQEGIFIVAAAGNSGTTIENVTPASMMDAVTVGAYNKDLLPCDFSNYSNESIISVTNNQVNHGELDGWAPGDEIWMAGMNGTYGYAAGTSASAAILSAIIASNLSWFADSNGKIYNHYDSYNLSTSDPRALKVIFIKRDLLDLHDPKYQNSKNVIANLLNNCDITRSQLPNEISLKCYTDIAKYQNLGGVFTPTCTKKVVWEVALPENFELLPDGSIVGNPTPEQGPLEGELYKKHSCSFYRTNIDDSEELVKVEIYVFKNVDVTIPEDDPAIIVTLLSCGTFASPSCGPGEFNSNCTYQCPFSLPCCYIGGCGKGYWSCDCGFCPSDRRLKSNIKRIGTHKLGIGIYEYDIFDRREVGVMADEVEKVLPEAVIRGDDGYQRVNYCLINRT